MVVKTTIQQIPFSRGSRNPATLADNVAFCEKTYKPIKQFYLFLLISDQIGTVPV